MTFRSDLPRMWRERAEALRPYAPSAAEAFTRAASELEEDVHAHLNEALTSAEAARESGYHPETVREKIRTGEWPNAGRPGRPRVRRRDIRPAGGTGGRTVGGPEFDEIVRDAVASRLSRDR